MIGLNDPGSQQPGAYRVAANVLTSRAFWVHGFPSAFFQPIALDHLTIQRSMRCHQRLEGCWRHAIDELNFHFVDDGEVKLTLVAKRICSYESVF